MKKASGHATISDVAIHAGVSTATVSRVTAGVGYVSEATRAKVQKSIDTLKFQPSLIAQSLRRQKSAVIGLIVTDIQNPFYPELVRGIEDEVQKRGYSLILCNSADESVREESYLNYLASHRADGIIICASGIIERHRKKVESFFGKVVLVDVYKDDIQIPTVSSDDAKGSALAGAYLAACGYPEIIYIGNAKEKNNGLPRFKGAKKGAKSTPIHYFQSEGNLASGGAVVKEILKKHKPPFGVIGHNDLTAIGVMHALTELGYKVPSEIGIVGYDNIAMSAFVNPSLTTISQEQSRLGEESMALMDQLIAGKKNVKNVIITPKLIERNSTLKINDGKSRESGN